MSLGLNQYLNESSPTRLPQLRPFETNLRNVAVQNTNYSTNSVPFYEKEQVEWINGEAR